MLGMLQRAVNERFRGLHKKQAIGVACECNRYANDSQKSYFRTSRYKQLPSDFLLSFTKFKQLGYHVAVTKLPATIRFLP